MAVGVVGIGLHSHNLQVHLNLLLLTLLSLLLLAVVFVIASVAPPLVAAIDVLGCCIDVGVVCGCQDDVAGSCIFHSFLVEFRVWKVKSTLFRFVR